MEIKGNIGDEVYIKAKINSIVINQDNIAYYLTVFDEELTKVAMYEGNIKFDEPKKPEKKVPEVKKDVEPIAPPKKRGRPRKTTVDDLFKKAKM